MLYHAVTTPDDDFIWNTILEHEGQVFHIHTVSRKHHRAANRQLNPDLLPAVLSNKHPGFSISAKSQMSYVIPNFLHGSHGPSRFILADNCGSLAMLPRRKSRDGMPICRLKATVTGKKICGPSHPAAPSSLSGRKPASVSFTRQSYHTLQNDVNRVLKKKCCT